MSAPDHPLRAPRDLTELPRVSPLLLGSFARYTKWYLRRHFQGVRLDLEGWRPGEAGLGLPTVFYLNHAAWWDPLVCLHLRQHLMPRVAAFAPIDATAVRKYGFFRRLGFFGIEAGTPRGAARFLRVAEAILSGPASTLWLTPQGRFTDVRERPVELRPGLGHLAARLDRPRPPLPAAGERRVQFIPLAIEYPFWEERLPQVLLRFGPPLVVDAGNAAQRDATGWTRCFEANLGTTLDALAVAACRRPPGRFLNLLEGRTGVGGVYDVWRRAAAALRGQRFDPRHGSL